jgi:tripeptide aminopeptidase
MFEAELEDRLIRYAAIDSQSDETSATAPSTAIQWNMARLLEAELTAMGAADPRHGTRPDHRFPGPCRYRAAI